MHSRGDRRGQIADFRDSFEKTKWLYLYSKCGIKTKTHFEWLLWHWSSLGQLNLEPTRPNDLVGYKVPTDLVKISVKEAVHMGFYYTTHYMIPVAPTKTWWYHDDVIKWKHFLRYWFLCWEFTGHRWIPRTKTSDAELWCFLWCATEQTVELETMVIWDAFALIMTSPLCTQINM